MYIYLALLLVLCIFAVKPKATPGSLFISFLLLFIIEAFRDFSVGTDTMNYISKYNADIINSVSGTVKGLEFGWTAFVRGNAAIFENSNRPILVESTFLFLLPIFIVAGKYHRDKAGLIILYTFLLYYYFNSFNTIRQSIAMSWCLWAYCAFEKGHSLKALAVFIVAISIHTTALAMLSLLVIKRLKIGLKWIIPILVATFIIGSLNWIAPLVGMIAGNETYAVYADAFISGGSSFSPTRLAVNILLVYLFIKTKGVEPMWNFMFAGVVILNLFASLPYVARLSQYFLFFQVLYFPYIKSKNARLFAGIYAFASFFFLLLSNVGEIVPYSFL